MTNRPERVAYIQKTTLPYEDNYLDLDPTVKDALGQPVCQIAADFKENEKKIGAFMQNKTEQWFMEAGAIAVEKGPPGTMGPSTHAYGGTRMGDRANSDANGRGLPRAVVRLRRGCYVGFASFGVLALGRTGLLVARQNELVGEERGDSRQI